jgi:hypothetical protein
MIFLSEILKSILLEISHDTVLYHRSMKKFKVGDIIKPTNTAESGHYGSSAVEIYMEAYRQEFFSDSPPRGKCIYCSVVPNSAFFGKGYLYEVKPRGRFLVTLASLINQIGGVWSREEDNQSRYSDRRFSSDFGSNEEYNQYLKDRNDDI